jgi:hypothetical protein
MLKLIFVASMLSMLSLSLSLLIPSASVCSKASILSSGVTSFQSVKNVQNKMQTVSLRSLSTTKLFMVPSDNGNDENENNEIKTDTELEKSFWFDTSPFMKNISIPSILFGSLLGAVIAFGTIFIPFFLPDDFSLPAGKD